jgi:hypothetical protein
MKRTTKFAQILLLAAVVACGLVLYSCESDQTEDRNRMAEVQVAASQRVSLAAPPDVVGALENEPLESATVQLFSALDDLLRDFPAAAGTLQLIFSVPADQAPSLTDVRSELSSVDNDAFAAALKLALNEAKLVDFGSVPIQTTVEFRLDVKAAEGAAPAATEPDAAAPPAADPDGPQDV